MKSLLNTLTFSSCPFRIFIGTFAAENDFCPIVCASVLVADSFSTAVMKQYSVGIHPELFEIFIANASTQLRFVNDRRIVWRIAVNHFWLEAVSIVDIQRGRL